MPTKKDYRAIAVVTAVFLASFYIPVEALRPAGRLANAAWESLYMLRAYAREHVILCLVPAFFIAGAVSIFVGKESIMRYLGPGANKIVAYGVASVSGSILAVCSCTILPLFAGIYRMGAGLGPASAFLYSGPAINVLAIVLTTRVLGIELGAARALGAIVFSVVIGLLMHLIFRKEEMAKKAALPQVPIDEGGRSLLKNGLYFASMTAILVFANWGRPAGESGLWYFIFKSKWIVTAFAAAAFALMLTAWFGVKRLHIFLAALPPVVLAAAFPGTPVLAFASGVVSISILLVRTGGEAGEWFDSSWGFARQILPLLFAGVIIAGALLGRPEHEGLIPSSWISGAVGGNSLWANLFASVAGAFMYFATLTEVPILQGLIGAGMGKGPALALLLAGPALSLPNMLVIRSVIGTKKTVVYVALVIAMATVSGLIYGFFFGVEV